MVAGGLRENFESLRGALRRRTRASHDRLDSLLAPLAVGDMRDYATFLSIQFRVRAGIERWADESQIDLAPPVVTPLIAEDLVTLGYRLPGFNSFTMPADADPTGLAWVIGGSALGNKSLLTRRHLAGHTGASRFLEDKSTIAYFTRLLPLLEAPTPSREIAQAALAAEAVFGAFLAAAENFRLDKAA